MATTVVRITHAETTAQLSEYLGAPASSPREACNDLARYARSLANGTSSGTVTIGEDDSTSATMTATLLNVIATDQIVINGVAFACVNSGATGDQFNKGADDTATAVNLAAKINASTTALVDNYVTATSAGAVVTITAAQPGILGNSVTLTTPDTTITLDPDAGRLAGGAERTTPTSYSL